MPEPAEYLIALLTQDVDELCRGNWRAAADGLATGGDVGEHPELVTITFRLRCVARNLRFQSVDGNVEGAWRQLATAAGQPGRPTVEPARSRRLSHLTWRVDRLVEREMADLEALRRIFADVSRGRRELVYAVVEYLTMIEFDPFTVRIHPRDRELARLEEDEYLRLRSGNRRDICARATNLRHFADARSGSVAWKTWQRAGGYPCLREHALRVLAEEPLTRGRIDLPVRLGRRRAWDYARGWVRDTAA